MRVAPRTGAEAATSTVVRTGPELTATAAGTTRPWHLRAGAASASGSGAGPGTLTLP